MSEIQEYIVEQRQVGHQTTIVHATSKADALRRVQAGEGDAVGFEITQGGGYQVWPSGRGDARGINPLDRAPSSEGSR